MLCYLRLLFFFSSTGVQQCGNQTLKRDIRTLVEVNEAHREISRSSVANENSPQTVEIRGIQPYTSKDIFQRFIENVSESMPQICKYDEQNGVAVVTFHNTEGNVLLIYLMFNFV